MQVDKFNFYSLFYYSVRLIFKFREKLTFSVNKGPILNDDSAKFGYKLVDFDLYVISGYLRTYFHILAIFISGF